MEDYFRVARTGDIMLLSSYTAGQIMQRFFTFSRYSHVAVIVRDRMGEIWIWHSSVHVSTADALCGTKHDGPQLSRAREMIPGYFNNGGYLISVRRLMSNQPIPQYDQLEARLVHNMMRKVKGTNYDDGIMRLSGGYFSEVIHESPFGDMAPPDSSYFCSELASASLIVMGIIDESRRYDEYAPVDFSESWQTLPLKTPYYYGNEIKILI